VGSNPTEGMDVAVCMRLFCICVVLCLVSGPATNLSLVQGALPSVKNDYGSKQKACALIGLEEPLLKSISNLTQNKMLRTSCFMLKPNKNLGLLQHI
jgi:hypothetical protein